jgi:hypothetical protein
MLFLAAAFAILWASSLRPVGAAERPLILFVACIQATLELLITNPGRNRQA